MIEVKCPRCREAFEVPAGLAGSSEECPACGHPVAVPAGAAARPAQASVDRPADPARAAVPTAPVQTISLAAPLMVGFTAISPCFAEMTCTILSLLVIGLSVLAAAIILIAALADNKAAYGFLQAALVIIGGMIWAAGVYAIASGLRYLRMLTNAAYGVPSRS